MILNVRISHWLMTAVHPWASCWAWCDALSFGPQCSEDEIACLSSRERRHSQSCAKIETPIISVSISWPSNRRKSLRTGEWCSKMTKQMLKLSKQLKFFSKNYVSFGLSMCFPHMKKNRSSVLICKTSWILIFKNLSLYFLRLNLFMIVLSMS